ncbi:hypothetical protein VTI74DRAFT_4605 [Chaetomium olivicolor]
MGWKTWRDRLRKFRDRLLGRGDPGPSSNMSGGHSANGGRPKISYPQLQDPPLPHEPLPIVLEQREKTFNPPAKLQDNLAPPRGDGVKLARIRPHSLPTSGTSSRPELSLQRKTSKSWHGLPSDSAQTPPQHQRSPRMANGASLVQMGSTPTAAPWALYPTPPATPPPAFPRLTELGQSVIPFHLVDGGNEDAATGGASKDRASARSSADAGPSNLRADRSSLDRASSNDSVPILSRHLYNAGPASSGRRQSNGSQPNSGQPNASPYSLSLYTSSNNSSPSPSCVQLHTDPSSATRGSSPARSFSLSRDSLPARQSGASPAPSDPGPSPRTQAHGTRAYPSRAASAATNTARQEQQATFFRPLESDWRFPPPATGTGGYPDMPERE